MIIRVGLPNYNGICPETEHTLTALKRATQWTVNLKIVSGTYPAKARNTAITLDKSHAKKQHFDFDYFLSMDADMAFDISNLERLIAHNLDIVSMAYVGRTDALCNYIMAGYWSKKPGISDYWVPADCRGLIRCGWVGMGACLIKKDVLENMEHPYFRHSVIQNGESANEVTEDWGFCISAAEAGCSMYVDCDNRAAHISH